MRVATGEQDLGLLRQALKVGGSDRDFGGWGVSEPPPPCRGYRVRVG